MNGYLLIIHSNDHVTLFEGLFMQARKHGVDNASNGDFNAAGAHKLATVNCLGATNVRFVPILKQTLRKYCDYGL